MFKTLRQQLAFQFVLISVVAYLLSLIAGSALFYRALENSIRSELNEHLIAMTSLIDLSNMVPRWRDRQQPLSFRQQIIQLFDSSGNLIDQIGNGGTTRLHDAHEDFTTSDRKWCILSAPLRRGQNVIGYLQIQTDIRRIDDGVQGWLLGTFAITAMLLAGLILAAFVVSGRAVRPVEQASEELRRFMADAGHELDTPLAIIQANAETMNHTLAAGGNDVILVEIISRTAQHMGMIINDLRLLSTTDLAVKRTKAVAIPMHELVEDTVEDFSALFQEKEIRLVSGNLDQCIVEGNPAELQRLLANLLKNALAYTDRGGEVTVSLILTGQKVELTVTDTGIGIPADCLQHVFCRFYRVDRSRSSTAGGTGLGLSIVQKIANDHGGQVRASSNPGKGSTFLVWLPAKPARYSEPRRVST